MGGMARRKAYTIEMRTITLPDGTEIEREVKVYPAAGTSEYERLCRRQERNEKINRTPRLGRKPKRSGIE